MGWSKFLIKNIWNIYHIYFQMGRAAERFWRPRDNTAKLGPLRAKRAEEKTGEYFTLWDPLENETQGNIDTPAPLLGALQWVVARASFLMKFQQSMYRIWNVGGLESLPVKFENDGKMLFGLRFKCFWFGFHSVMYKLLGNSLLEKKH